MSEIYIGGIPNPYIYRIPCSDNPTKYNLEGAENYFECNFFPLWSSKYYVKIISTIRENDII